MRFLHLILRLVPLAGLLVAGPAAAGPNPPIAVSADESVPLAPRALHWIDPSGEAGPEAARRAFARASELADPTAEEFPAGPARWLQLAVSNPGSEPLALYLRSADHFVDSLTLHVYDGDRLVEQFAVGDQRPFAERPVVHRDFLLPIELPAGAERELLVRIQREFSATPARFLELVGQEPFWRGEVGALVHRAAFLGFALAMLLSNGIVYLLTRERSYPPYLATVACTATLICALDGLAFQYLWPDNLWLQQKAIMLLLSGTLASHAWFSLEFLQLRESLPQVARCLRATMLACGGIAAGHIFWVWDAGVLWVELLNPAVFLPSFAAAAYLAWQGEDELRSRGRHYLLTWTPVVLVAVVYVWGGDHAGAGRDFVRGGLGDVASMLQMLLVSTVLGAQLRRLSLAREQLTEEREAARRESMASLEQYRQIFENASDGLYHIDFAEERVLHANAALARMFGYESVGQLMEESAGDLGAMYADPLVRGSLRARLAESGQLENEEVEYRRRDGSRFWGLVSMRLGPVLEGGQPLVEGSVIDITNRRESEQAARELASELERRVSERTAELVSTQESLVDAARAAGLAETATGVLHNIGNGLNSVITSFTVLRRILEKDRVGRSLGRVSTLLRDNRDDLARFLREDPKGQCVPELLSALTRLGDERRGVVVAEIDRIEGLLDYIVEIVGTQQAYARAGGVATEQALGEVLDDALRVCAASRDFAPGELSCHCPELEPVALERHKVVQVLVNLIQNARRAMDDVKDRENCLAIEVRELPGQLEIDVRDNGPGVASELETRIFEHGFTTKVDGHGFGLHLAANFASELGGSLRLSANRAGEGCCFTLVLPTGPPGSTGGAGPEGGTVRSRP